MIETFFLVAVLGLAAFRITRFFTKDSLLNELRWWIERTSYLLDETGEPLDYLPWIKKNGEESKTMTLLRGKAADLVTCSWCLGFWVSMAVYLLWDAGTLHVGLLIFAVAGVQGILSSRDKSS